MQATDLSAPNTHSQYPVKMTLQNKFKTNVQENILTIPLSVKQFTYLKDNTSYKTLLS